MKTLFSRFTKRERFLFLFTASVIGATALFILVLQPVMKEWGRLSIGLDSTNAKLYKNLKLLSNKDAIEKEYNKYKEYIQKSGGAEDEAAAILKEIETTASNCQVAITSIKPKGTKQLKNYRKFTVEVVSEAKLDQFLKFIYELEGSKKLLKVERLVLSLKSSQSDILKGTLIIRKISF